MTTPGEYAIDLSALETEARGLEVKIKSLVGRVRQLESAVAAIEQSSDIQKYQKSEAEKRELELRIETAEAALRGDFADD